MRILDLYIGRIIASTTFLTLAVFVSLSGIIKFVEEMEIVNLRKYSRESNFSLSDKSVTVE